MKTAIKYFLISTFLVLLGLGMAWIYLRSKGDTNPLPSPLESQFFKDQSDFIIVQDVTSRSFEEISVLPNSQILWVDVQVTRDQKVVITKAREIRNPNFNPQSPDRSPDIKLEKLPVRYLNWSDLEKASEKTILLEKLLQSLPSHRWIVNVVDYTPNGDKVFSDLISSTQADEKIIFQSEQNGPLTDLRKLEPMWLYGTSRAQIVQTIWLATIGLQKLAPLKGDVLITPLHAGAENQHASLVNEDVIAEARRRSMKVLIGPVSSEHLENVKKFNVDGAIVAP
jgi:hypothetical protein